MPPPVTPSPHRFVIKRQPPPPRYQPTQEQTPRPGGSQQFNATPRFTFSSTPRLTGTQAPPSSTPANARYLTPARPSSHFQENIDDPSSDDFPDDLHSSIETNDVDVDIDIDSTEEVEDGYEIDNRDSKRRRISLSQEAEEEQNDDTIIGDTHDAASPPLPILSSPVARRPASTSKPRFLLSTQAPPSTPQSTAPTTFSKPPRFRPPDPAEPAQANDPLPEQFSPHRKGQKYVYGGLAAEVRDWLVNLDSTLPAHAAHQTKDDPWVVRVLIEEVTGGAGTAMNLVRGRKLYKQEGDQGVDDMATVRVILAGEAAGMTLYQGRKVQITKGQVVGIKGPVWEVVIEGEKWGVGVDWKVLNVDS